MALDGAADKPDGTSTDTADSRGSGVDTAAERDRPAEVQSQPGNYSVSAADRALYAGQDQHGETQDQHGETGRSGWDAIPAQDRPPVDSIHLTPERGKHILDGDATGGGHRSGTGSPGKTEFPAGWSDEKSLGNVLDVAQHPDSPPVHQNWNDSWLCTGTRDGVQVWAVVQRDGEIRTGWPEPGGPGVVQNPRRGAS